VSCWGDGPSQPYAQRLAERFPGTTLQPKGLIATEAFVSIPLLGVNGSVPAITSHFFEFIAVGGNGRDAVLVDELCEGIRYEVVVTTAAGLFRYRLRDVVEVIGFYGKLPLLRFEGKSDRVSDLFGEKLSEYSVTRAMASVCAIHGIRPTFSVLAPDQKKKPPGYVWFTCISEKDRTKIVPTMLEREMEKELAKNVHYAVCRQQGQLGSVELCQMSESGAESYLHRIRDPGAKIGDIKIPALGTQENICERLRKIISSPVSKGALSEDALRKVNRYTS